MADVDRSSRFIRVATYVDGDVDADAVMLGPRTHVLVPLLGLVVADYQRVLGQVLEETFRLRPVDVEVQRLGDGAQRQKGENRSHDDYVVDRSGVRAVLADEGGAILNVCSQLAMSVRIGVPFA